MTMTNLTTARSRADQTWSAARARDEERIRSERAALVAREERLARESQRVASEREALDRDLAVFHEMQDERGATAAKELLSDIVSDRRASNATLAMADAIIQAGKTRREGLAPGLPADEKAKAIVLSGRRRRGEQLAAQDERWLDAYCLREERRRQSW